MKIAISAETTCDLSKAIIVENDIKIVPFEIVVGTDTFKDGEMTTEQLFDMVDKRGVLPKTNAINEYEYTEYFENLKKDYDAIVHISLSSGLSSSCSNAIRASKNVKNVFVVDSLSLSTGIGLLVLYAKDLVDDGYLPEDVARMVQERAKSLQVSFVVERLDYLYKGGRCNALSLLGANLLKIRPRLVVKEGKIGSDKKYRGSMEKVIAKYCDETLSEYSNPDLERVFLTYTTATPEMVNAAREMLIRAGFKNIYETNAGCTIASHCGAHTLGILYFNDGNRK